MDPAIYDQTSGTRQIERHCLSREAALRQLHVQRSSSSGRATDPARIASIFQHTVTGRVGHASTSFPSNGLFHLTEPQHSTRRRHVKQRPFTQRLE
jgi:hypothetical protein